MVKAALMVCTRNRPASLSRWLEAAAEIARSAPWPCVIVVDNNDASQEALIRQLADERGVEIVYVHCKVPGYASPRNAAIEAALATDAQVLVFVDDDDIPEPDLVSQHVAALDTYGADVVRGWSADHDRTLKEGARVKWAGTRNVAFRRWIVEAAGLRFDERLNKTGSEDNEFFQDVHRTGAIMVTSRRARVNTRREPRTRAVELLCSTAPAQNKIYIRRIRHGFLPAFGKFLWLYGSALVAGNVLVALGQLCRSQRLVREGQCKIWTHRFAVRGLYGKGLDRAAIKQGRRVEFSLEPEETSRRALDELAFSLDK